MPSVVPAVRTGADVIETAPGTGAVDPVSAFATAAPTNACTVATVGGPRSE